MKPPTVRIALLALAGAILVAPAFAQQLSLPSPGDNQRAEVTQWMGLVAVTVVYNSPDVHAPNGDDRSGHIWGELVPWGIAPNPFYPAFGTAEAMPWRGGANENTTVRFSHDVEVEGQPLAAGTYGLHFIPGEKEWGVIFSRNSTSWGSFFYDAGEDALRVEVTPQEAPYREWLTYDFIDRQLDSTVLAMHWEKLLVPVRISVPDAVGLYVARIDDELRGTPGFFWQNWNNAVLFLLQRQTRPEKALEWARIAAANNNRGQENFTTLTTLYQALIANGETAEAEEVFHRALDHPTATAGQIHQAGRSLIAQGEKEKAMAVFRTNYERFDGAWPTEVGMARGLAALGRFDEALAHARKALAQAEERKDAINVPSLRSMIERLEAGSDVN
ncbi:MAG: DUF2911 domain-containing protein [Acidobacteria bacterium]|nr:MAG: DUF2911 domain-containing protein [Acidobacteriota bacterium]